MANIHVEAITDNVSDAGIADLIGANMTAVSKSNAASSAMKEGQLDEAIQLHREALALKLKAYPETSAQAGVSLNGLGEALLRAGRLDEADEAFRKALAIREKEGPDQDAAATRDNVGALREAQGRLDEAREVRLRGEEKQQILCGNYKCPTNKLYARSDLKACGACAAVFYCSKGCQVKDWKARHKPFCKGRAETA